MVHLCAKSREDPTKIEEKVMFPTAEFYKKDINTVPLTGLEIMEKITFPSEMLKQILPFRPNFNLSDWQTSTF